MKHLKGYGKRYFSLAIIAMYSTIDKLTKAENCYQYHIKPYEFIQPSNAPPSNLFN
jgi:hypothetical protein